MPREDLLPGVNTRSCPPRVLCDARAAIRTARRRAYFRDALQISLLVAVDFLFVYWPDSRLPFLAREESLAVLRAMNGLLIADLWLTRAMPKWAARRISATWSRAEQQRIQS